MFESGDILHLLQPAVRVLCPDLEKKSFQSDLQRDNVQRFYNSMINMLARRQPTTEQFVKTFLGMYSVFCILVDDW